MSRGTRAGLAGVAARATTASHVTRLRAVGTLGALGLLPALSASGAVLDPDPDQARRWVEEELAKDEYRDRRSLLQQLIDWLRGRLDDLQNPAGRGDLSFPPFVIALLAVLVVVVLVVLATRVRRERRVVGASATVLGDSTLTAAELRARAQRALAEGRYDDTVLDTVRAVAREADSRTLLTDAPALTAHEIGQQLRVVFPAQAEAVTRATDRFDAVAYGHLVASREHAEDVLATDDALRRARPVLPSRPRGGGPGGPGPGDDGGSGVLVVAGRGSWSPAGGRAGAGEGRRGEVGPGGRERPDDPGSVWTTGGGG